MLFKWLYNFIDAAHMEASPLINSHSALVRCGAGEGGRGSVADSTKPYSEAATAALS